MAGKQEVVGITNKSSSDIPNKHKAKLIELQKEAQKEILKLNLATPSNVAVRAIMWNNTPGDMPFKQYKNWSGSVVGQYPNRINLDRTAEFNHYGRPPTDTMGSYGAVIYIGTHMAGATNNCAWLLAWHVPGDGQTPNKVYVETGPISKYPVTDMNWDRIRNSLDASSNSSYYIDDENTRAEATALITEFGNTVGISATFDIN